MSSPVINDPSIDHLYGKNSLSELELSLRRSYRGQVVPVSTELVDLEENGRSHADAISLIERVRIRFLTNPHVYHIFLSLMYKLDALLIDTEAVYEHIQSLFDGHTDLIEEFSLFLPIEMNVKQDFPPPNETSAVSNETNLEALSDMAVLLNLAKRSYEKVPYIDSSGNPDGCKYQHLLQLIIGYGDVGETRTYIQFRQEVESLVKSKKPNDELPGLILRLLDLNFGPPHLRTAILKKKAPKATDIWKGDDVDSNEV